MSGEERAIEQISLLKKYFLPERPISTTGEDDSEYAAVSETLSSIESVLLSSITSIQRNEAAIAECKTILGQGSSGFFLAGRHEVAAEILESLEGRV